MANRNCCLCNSVYDYCASCSKHRNDPPWKSSFEDLNCRNIYATLLKYRDNKISKNEAKELLNNLDLVKKEYYSEYHQNMINEIMGNDEPIINIVKPSEEIEIIEEIEEVKIEETEDVKVSENETLEETEKDTIVLPKVQYNSKRRRK